MDLTNDSNARRRLDAQEMRERDDEVARLREEGVSFRVIAQRLACSLGSVQKAVRRVEARRAVVVDDDDEPRGLPLAAGADRPIGEVRFAGVDPMDPRIELFADERGRRFNLLDLYRHTRVDSGALYRDACRQLEAAQ